MTTKATTNVIADTAVGTTQMVDNSVTLAKLEDGTQGDTLYYGASGAPARLGAGTSGQFLKTQGAGANPVWSNLGITPTKLVDNAALSAAATHTITDALGGTNAYRVLIWIDTLSLTNDNQTVDIRLGPTAGVLTSGYESVGVTVGTNERIGTAGFAITGTAATFDAADDLNMVVDLVHLGGDEWVGHAYGYEPTGTAQGMEGRLMPFDVTGELDVIDISTSDTLNGGNVSLWYWA